MLVTWMMPHPSSSQPTPYLLPAEQWSGVQMRSRTLLGFSTQEVIPTESESLLWREQDKHGEVLSPHWARWDSEWGDALGWRSERMLWLCGARGTGLLLSWALLERILPCKNSWFPGPLTSWGHLTRWIFSTLILCECQLRKPGSEKTCS